MIIEVNRDCNLEEKLDLQNGIFYIDNQIDKLGGNYKNKINIDEKFPLKIEHIIATGNFLQKNVKYFSFANLIEKSITDYSIENSRAHQISQHIESHAKENKILLCNSYFYPKNKKITVVEYEVSKEVEYEVSKEVEYEVSKEVEYEVSKDFKSKEVEYEVSKEVEYAVSKDIEHGKSKDIKHEVSKEVKYGKSKDIECVASTEVEYVVSKDFKSKGVEIVSKDVKFEELTKLEIDQEIVEVVPFITFKEYGNLMRKEVFLEYFSLIGAKILSSSFFLHEFLDFWPYFSEYPLTQNRFFNNLQEAKDFFSEISYEDEDFYKLPSFEDFSSALEFLKSYKKITKFSSLPYAVFKKDNIFCYSGISTSDHSHSLCHSLCNSLFLEINSINVNSELNFQHRKRELCLFPDSFSEAKVEDYSNFYDFYMHGVLKLHKKSIGNLFLRNIYMFFLNKRNFLPFSSPFLEKLKTECIIKNNKIFHDNFQVFFSQSNWDSKKIQKFSKSKNISKFYIANIEKNQLELYYSNYSYTSIEKPIQITY